MTQTPLHPRDTGQAVVVGIDVYPFVDAKPLRGCRNDAQRIAALLQTRFGFRVSLLLDAKATREALLEEMERLLETTRAGDRIVVHFSGHGSQIRGEDGSIVESLVPHDSGRGAHPNRDITDQELYRWVLGLSEVTSFITLIIDSCHAGGAVRDSDESFHLSTNRGLGIDRRPGGLADKRAFLAPFAPWERETTARDIGPSGWLPLSERYSLIAACRAGERAREIEDPETSQHHGILTCFLCEELERTTGRPSHREVFDPVACRVTQRFPEQHPQLEGAWDREIFGPLASIPMAFTPVASRQGSRIELAAGVVHGLVTGSEWQIYPAGTRSAEAATLRGRVRLDTILAVASTGHLLEETSQGAVAAGDRAVEVARPPGAWRLAVAIDERINPADTKVLGERIDASPFLARVPMAPLTIGVVDRTHPGSMDRRPPGFEPSWAVFAHSGRLVMPPLPVGSPAAVRQLLANLEILARHRLLAELRHPEPDHTLRDTLTIELFRRRPGQGWRLAEPEVVYVEGDGLGIRVGHRHTSPLHIAILDLGLTGSISLLHPVRGARDPLEPGQKLELGLRADDLAFELFVPQELPFPGDTFDQAREILVFIATTEATDFGVWFQKGVRGLEVADREEKEALERDTRPAQLPSGCTTWTATFRSFWLRRSV